MIKQYNSLLNKDLNNIIYEDLLNHSGWNIIVDKNFSRFYDATDSGMILASMSNGISSGEKFDKLNFYAEIILKLILKNTTVKLEHTEVDFFSNPKMIRCYWNYYHTNSIGVDHPDTVEEDHWSIVYYLNDVEEAGTRIIENDNVLIVPSIATNAVLFPSNYIHCGLPPKNFNHRCCLNIIFKAQTFHPNPGKNFSQDKNRIVFNGNVS